MAAIVLRERGGRALRRSVELDARIATFSSVTVSAVGIVQTWRRRAAKRKAAALAGALQPGSTCAAAHETCPKMGRSGTEIGFRAAAERSTCAGDPALHRYAACSGSRHRGCRPGTRSGSNVPYPHCRATEEPESPSVLRCSSSSRGAYAASHGPEQCRPCTPRRFGGCGRRRRHRCPRRQRRGPSQPARERTHPPRGRHPEPSQPRRGRRERPWRAAKESASRRKYTNPRGVRPPSGLSGVCPIVGR